jgi:hypothetical protein
MNTRNYAEGFFDDNEEQGNFGVDIEEDEEYKVNKEYSE